MDSLLFHPKLVHLPIALGVLMPLVAGGLLVAWWRELLPRRSWAIAIALQGILLGSGIVALRSGEVEEETVESVVPETAIEAHEEAATAFVWASGAVLLLMVLPFALPAEKARLPLAAGAVVGTLVVLALGHRTGEAGGHLVYEHGAAQAYARTAAGAGGGEVAANPEVREGWGAGALTSGDRDEDEDDD